MGPTLKTSQHCLDVKLALTLMRFVCHVSRTKRMTDGKINWDYGLLEEEEVTKNDDKFSHCTNLGIEETKERIFRIIFNDAMN